MSSLSISDHTVRWPFPVPTNTYHKYCRNVYSQNGEDGILDQLLTELNGGSGSGGGTFCEFGASDGVSSSNVLHLVKSRNFTGMLIEADEARYRKCVENYRSYPDVQVFQGFVLYDDAANNLDSWLARGNMKKDLDVLSIDIDCDDYYVWDNMKNYNPKIVIFEVNSYRDPIYDELPKQPSNAYNIDLLRQQNPSRVALGCSFISAVKLGLNKGYVPVSFTGNIIFVRRDLVEKLREFPYKLSNNPYDYVELYTHLSMWGNEWYSNNGLMVNAAIRDYYLSTNRVFIDIEWLKNRVREIGSNRNTGA
jgi:hypothetical protein